MRDNLRHRGPDDSGSWWSADGCVGLAQRRLAIIDLTPAGRQPMADHSGGYHVTFNGEIYNYQELRQELAQRGHAFRSSSDTEVLLASYREWGVECLTRLNGMFAFGIFDQQQRRLFLARDRAGEKPLFYRHSPGQFAFASELKALMADPGLERRINPEALHAYLQYGYVPGSLCILKAVRKLPPGHFLLYDVQRDDIRTWRYWQLPDFEAEPAADDEQMLHEFEQLLEQSVRRQLVADVPVGVLLSGGIDSSLVTAMAARVSTQPVRTFNISFPNHGGYDESRYARLVARHFGTEHTELAAEASTVDLLPQLAAQFDEPLGDSSIVPTFLVSRLVRQHCTVALGGDGGDELFAGYLQHAWILRVQRQQRWIPHELRQLLGGAVDRLLPQGLRGRNYLRALLADSRTSVARFNTYFDAAWRKKLLGQKLVLGSQESDPEVYKSQIAARFNTPLRQATAVDFLTYLCDDILVKVDRASMLASLEIRAPFLDCQLIEFAFGRLPDRLRATATERKILPRRLAKRLLPAQLDLQRKQGFSLPLSAWLRGNWGDCFREILRDADPAIFSPTAIRSLFNGQDWGLRNAERLFALTIFELWRRHYRATL